MALWNVVINMWTNVWSKCGHFVDICGQIFDHKLWKSPKNAWSCGQNLWSELTGVWSFCGHFVDSNFMAIYDHICTTLFYVIICFFEVSFLDQNVFGELLQIDAD